MATGVVSVCTGGEVRLKIIVSTGGELAEVLAGEIKRMGRVPQVEEAYNLALLVGFGNFLNRLVIAGDGDDSEYRGNEPVRQAHYKGFSDPNYNAYGHGQVAIVSFD